MTLPAGWVRTTLGDVAAWGSGGTPSAGQSAYYGGRVPWAVIGDLNDAVVLHTRSSITEAGLANSSAKVIPRGAVLVAMYGSIGKLGIVGREMTTNQAIASAVPKAGLLPKFLFYYLLHQRRALAAEGKGATQRNISQTLLKSWQISMPENLEEQRRIVDLLEDHLSRLDAAEDYATTAIKRLQGIAESALRGLLADVRAERPLGELLDVPLGNGKSVPTRDDGFPVLRLTALKDDGVDLRERKGGDWTRGDAQRYLVAHDDFLLARGNGSRRLVGRGSLVRDHPDAVAYPDTMIRVRVKSQDMSAEFLDVVWNSAATRSQVEAEARTTAGIYKVNQKQVAAIRLPVPSLAEQVRITTRMAEVDEQARRTRDVLERAQRQGTAVRAALLAAAFSGKLTGRHTDQEMIETAVANERAVVGAG